MPTWYELEQRFGELRAELRFARLDRQFGTDGEFWRVAASGSPIANAKFKALATIAGRKLTTSSLQLPDEVAQATDDETRWFKMITRSLSFYRPGFVGEMRDDDGKTVGWIGTGSLNDPAAVSAATCLELMAMTHEESAARSSVIINQSGHGSRVNLSSTDNSSNTIFANSSSLFQQIRTAVEQSIPPPEQDEVLRRLADLEASVAKPSFTERYQDFMQVVANHATVLAPFLPALASLLAK
jgi:hypothetical protein